MKARVGQYFRNHKNEILEIIEIVNTNGKWVTNDLKRTYHIGEIKVADTPQELIEVGDLVKHNCNDETVIEEVILIITEASLETTNTIMGSNWVTKIYTPNNDNSIYTLQWEAE